MHEISTMDVIVNEIDYNNRLVSMITSLKQAYLMPLLMFPAPSLI